MRNIKTRTGETINIDDPDCIYNLIRFSSELSNVNPDLSKMVTDTWAKAHDLRNYILDNDETTSHDQLVEFAKMVRPLLADVVPQVGKINTNNPSGFNQALIMCFEIIGVENEPKPNTES